MDENPKRFWEPSLVADEHVQKTKHKKRSKQHNRNSAQIVVEAHNLRVSTKVAGYEGVTSSPVAPTCSLVVTQPDNDHGESARAIDKNANRLSIASNSSVESSRSEGDNTDSKDQATSVFYVVWD